MGRLLSTKAGREREREREVGGEGEREGERYIHTDVLLGCDIIYLQCIAC